MTTIDYAAHAPQARPSLTNVFATVFAAPGLFLKRRFIAARTRAELYGLSDRQLEDIGLERAEIHTLSARMAARVNA